MQQVEILLDDEFRPPDIQVFITKKPLGLSQIQYEVSLFSPQRGFILSPNDVINLNPEAEEYLSPLIEEMNEGVRRRRIVIKRVVVEHELKSFGENIWQEAVPREIQRAYWEGLSDSSNECPSPTTIWLISEEPLIPWEAVNHKPVAAR